ncbi:MAG TPA: ABC transporter substrate-binding protein, partial [Acidimicrobiia bacterium]|nr:ABC transporter substrate-binding protein [Acidimicrobiia bacterium]
MDAHRSWRRGRSNRDARLGPRRSAIVAVALTVVVALTSCGSGTKTGPSATVTTSVGGPGRSVNTPLSKTLGVGVTASTIKVGVALVDFKCIAAYIQTMRIDEYKVYQAFIDDINAHGGIAGRKIVPVFQTFCPIVPAPALSLCTKFTEDDHVFAVIGDFVDLTGQAQPCIANRHKTVLITIDLTRAIIDSSPPGMIIGFDPLQERTVSVLLELLRHQHTLDGKKVAVLGEATTEHSVKTVLVPDLQKMGVNLGSTAILTIAGSDTTAASIQLQSFIEKWKTEGVNTVFLSGRQVSAQQFVPALVKAMPGVQLIADNGNVDTYGQNLQKAGARPNPYDGILAVGGLSARNYDQSANWKYCAAIYEASFHQTAPDQETVVPGPSGHTLDINGSITDSCTELTMLHDIGERVGTYLNDANWVNAVDHYGTI